MSINPPKAPGYAELKAARDAASLDPNASANWKDWTLAVNGATSATSGLTSAQEAEAAAARSEAARMDELARRAAIAKSPLEELRFELQTTTRSAAEIAMSLVNAGYSASQLGAAFQQAVNENLMSADDAAKALVSRFGTDLNALTTLGHTVGRQTMSAIAQGIMANQQAPLDGMKNLLGMIQNEGSVTSQIALLYGMYISTDLAHGLASGDPAVRAAAEAQRQTITDQLDALTNGAFSAGTNASMNLAAGIASKQAQQMLYMAGQLAGNAATAGIASMLTNIAGIINQAVGQYNAKKNQWQAMAPTAGDANAAYNHWKKIAAGGQSAADAAKQYASAMKSALDQVASQAHQYFQKVHDDAIKALEDANKAKNLLIQKPVTAEQKWLSDRQKAIQEANLRRAVGEAKTPEEQLAAVQALKDFLLQKTVDADQALADTQKNYNDDQLEEQKKAEDKRYQDQLNSFDRQMQALEDFLTKHHVSWQRAQQMVIGLLHSYGITYQSAGSKLGFSFEQGLRDSIAGIKDAGKAAGSAAVGSSGMGSPYIATAAKTAGQKVGGTTSGTGGGTTGFAAGVRMSVGDIIAAAQAVATAASGPKGFGGALPQALTAGQKAAYTFIMGMLDKMPKFIRDMIVAQLHAWKYPGFEVGSWSVPATQLAVVHKGEMIFPAAQSEALRKALSSPTRLPSSETGGRASTSGSDTGGGTLIVKIGEEVLDEIVDQRLYVRGTVYRQSSVATIGPKW